MFAQHGYEDNYYYDNNCYHYSNRERLFNRWFLLTLEEVGVGFWGWKCGGIVRRGGFSETLTAFPAGVFFGNILVCGSTMRAVKARHNTPKILVSSKNCPHPVFIQGEGNRVIR